MKNLFCTSIAVATLTMASLVPAFAGEIDAGTVDFGQLMPSVHGQFVEVNLSQGMLKFAARIAAHQEPEAADLINNLRHIRINVVGMDDSNRADTTDKIQSIRRKPDSEGWTQVAAVRNGEDGDNVDVHVKQHGDDMIDGLVVTVLDRKGNAVFVNIVGNISAEQLGVIAERFDIDQLRHIRVKKSKDA